MEIKKATVGGCLVWGRLRWGLFVVQTWNGKVELLTDCNGNEDADVSAFIGEVWHYIAASFSGLSPDVLGGFCYS